MEVSPLFRRWLQEKGIFYRNPKSYGCNQTFIIHRDASKLVYTYYQDTTIAVYTHATPQDQHMKYTGGVNLDVRDPECFPKLEKLLDPELKLNNINPIFGWDYAATT